MLRSALLLACLVCVSHVPAIAAPSPIFNDQGKLVGVARFNIEGVLYDLWFSPGGLSYDEAVTWFGAQGVTLKTERRAKKVTLRIRRLFNQSTPPIMAEDVWWANLDNDDHHGDVTVPYAVTELLVPHSYTGWDGKPTYVWGRRPLFVFERDRRAGDGGTWTFISPHTSRSDGAGLEGAWMLALPVVVVGGVLAGAIRRTARTHGNVNV